MHWFCSRYQFIYFDIINTSSLAKGDDTLLFSEKSPLASEDVINTAYDELKYSVWQPT